MTKAETAAYGVSKRVNLCIANMEIYRSSRYLSSLCLASHAMVSVFLRCLMLQFSLLIDS